MTAVRVGIPMVLLVAGAWASLELHKGGIAAAPRAIGFLSILPSVFVPLLLPRSVSATAAKYRRIVESVSGDSYAELWDPAPEVDELRRKNRRLAKELRELRAAYAELAREAGERVEAARRLTFLAYHDALTGLPNRALLMDRLTQTLAYAQRAGTGVLVAYIDLDHFKHINDSMGHAAGDRVLTEIAARIASCMRESDTAGRIGGDEFVLVCSTGDGLRDGGQIEARLQRVLQAPVDVDGTAVTIGASLGMSMFPRDGSDPAQLIDAADKAMYSAKLSNRA